MQGSRSPRRGAMLLVAASIAAVLPLVAASAPAGAQAGPQAVPGKGSSVSPRLTELAERAEGGATSNRADAEALDLAPTGPGSLLRNQGDLVVNVRFSMPVTPLDESQLRAAGARIVSTLPDESLASIAIPASAIDAVAAVRGVAWMEEVLEPRVGRSGAPLDRSGLARALQEGGATSNATCAPVISEGDGQLAAAAARSTFGVDGTGVIVGVLSDSYDNRGGASVDIAAGELPGPGNPCGRTTPVQVQSDLASGGSDEGRAMAQVIHDLAPGATIRMATAFNGDVAFANEIRALAAAGAKVIVDDVTYFNEAMYQDGVIAKAILDVTAAGVTYFSSAGNQNLRVGGADVAGYEAPAFRPTSCPAVLGSPLYRCHDWDPGAGVDDRSSISLGPGATIQVRLGWSEPQFGITTDFDLVLLDSLGTSVRATSVANSLVSQTASEILSYTNSSSSPTTVNLVVARYDGTGTPRFRFVFQRYSGPVSWEWSTPGAGDVVGPVAIGHNMMRGTGSTAAIRFDTTTAPEAFSSRGPATYCWNPVSGTTPATPLAGCVPVNPTITATNGGANSFFGELISGVWRFFGTSQAAPHAAAIAALQVQARPCRTPAQILAAQQASAVAIGSFGPTAVGAGRLQAPAAISNLASCAPGAPTSVAGTPGNGQVALSWSAPASNGGSPVTGYRVTPFVGASAQAAVTFSSTATTQTITGLTNGTGYSFRVAAINAAGAGVDSVPSAVLTPTEPFAPFTSWSALVTRIHTDLLGVAPTTVARNAYVSRLSGGSLTVGGFVAELRASADQAGNVDPVTRLYRAYFLRIPDRGGLTFWIRQRRSNGRTLNAISDSFAASSEFRTKYGSLSNRQFVELVYLNVLGRPGERGGVEFWTSRLDRRVSSRGQVMTGFSESSEYRRKQVAEVDVSVLFILLLGRAPTTAEFTSLVAALEAPSTTLAEVAAQLLASPVYAARIG